jgi:death on curing protein
VWRLIATDSVDFQLASSGVALAVALLGEPPPIRDLGLLAAAAARPQASAFGDDAYPDLWTKAAALLHSVVKNQPLVDGNKRLGWLACAVFLDINGTDPTTASNDDVRPEHLLDAALEICAGRPHLGTADSSVVGSMVVETSVMIVAGKPEIRACSRMASSFSAR